MKLREILQKDHIIYELKATSAEAAIDELIAPLEKRGLDRLEVFQALIEREKLGSTGIGKGVAIPHCRVKEIDNIITSFGRSSKGIEFGAADGKPVHSFFVLLAPGNSASLHLAVLARISRIFIEGNIQNRILKATSAKEIYDIIIGEDEKYV